MINTLYSRHSQYSHISLFFKGNKGTVDPKRARHFYPTQAKALEAASKLKNDADTFGIQARAIAPNTGGYSPYSNIAPLAK